MNRRLSASPLRTIAVKSEGPFFSPGELVRLRMHWDDVDDDEETRTFRIANMISIAPPYYAAIEPVDNENPMAWNYLAINPLEVGIHLQNVAGTNQLVTVLFKDVKVRIARNLLEPYNGST